MKNDATSNTDNSAATSPGDADPLEQEAAMAQAAILRQLEEIKARLDKATSLSGVVERHPWLSLSAASALGILAAGVVFAPRPPREARTAQKAAAPTNESVAPAPWWTPLVGPVFDILKVVVERWLLHWLTNPATQASPTTEPSSTSSPASEANDTSKHPSANGNGPTRL
jgi:hypothetical protein